MMRGPEHDAKAAQRRRVRMEMIDRLPRETRELVHVYGWSVVHSFLECGMKNPKHIRHCITRVIQEMSPISHGGSVQGVATWKKFQDVDAAGAS